MDHRQIQLQLPRHGDEIILLPAFDDRKSIRCLGKEQRCLLPVNQQQVVSKGKNQRGFMNAGGGNGCR